MARPGFDILRRSRSALLVSIALLGSARVSFAEETAAASELEIVAPTLLAPAEARYPDEARAAGLEAVVRLKLTLDAQGVVRHAEVVEPAGHGFDEAALEAAYQLRFSPALRNGRAVGARILYEHDFRMPTAGAPTAGEPMSSEPMSSAPAAPATSAPSERVAAKPSTAPVKQPRAPASPSASTQAPVGVPVDEGEEMEVVVRGRSEAESLRRSARSVKVVDLDEAKRESADMGQVLAREEGVSVRRGGGLGADTRFSLNGLTGDQVRFFLDGVPLALAGYPSGIADVPVDLVERVDVYAGVVPIQFGADALGGAVNLVTDHTTPGFGASGSYQVGSFGTHRITLGARSLHEPTGFFAKLEGFHDQTKNDYDVQVEVADELGRPYTATVPRFHDAYRASGGSLELGLVNRPYAKRLLARFFVSDYDKEAQNNFVMSVPYGAVTFGETSYGGSLHYENALSDDASLDLLVGYTKSLLTYLDVSECFYDWFGRCIDPNNSPGEIDGQPHDQLLEEDAVIGRANLGWHVLPDHQLRLSVAPSLVRRTGDERRDPTPDSPDPLNTERQLTTLVSGVEWEALPFADVLQNIAFAKSYSQWLRSEELVSGGAMRERRRDSFDSGVGDSLRVSATPWLYFKASYEYATRLPQAKEVFGDGKFVTANLELEPERSHNANIGAYFDLDQAPPAFGAYRASVNGFLRDAHDQIVMLGDDRKLTYQNVLTARCLGVEGAIGWTSPKRYVSLDGNATYQSQRNASKEGSFAPYYGDRIPNRPYLFANGSATFRLEQVIDPRDALSLTWYSGYVHSFYRNWESIGRRDTKQVIDSQLVHTLAFTHTLDAHSAQVSSTFEVDNVTNARAYDFFGVQKPGRAFYVKTTLQL